MSSTKVPYCGAAVPSLWSSGSNSENPHFGGWTNSVHLLASFADIPLSLDTVPNINSWTPLLGQPSYGRSTQNKSLGCSRPTILNIYSTAPSLAPPPEYKKRLRHRGDQQPDPPPAAVPVPAPAAAAVVQTAVAPVQVVPLPGVVVVSLAAGGAPHQRHLVGGGPLVGPVGAGAVAGPLAVVEQVAAVGVLLQAEELVLGVGQPDGQGHAAVGQRHVLLHAHLPGALGAARVAVEDVEERGGGVVHGLHAHVVH